MWPYILGRSGHPVAVPQAETCAYFYGPKVFPICGVFGLAMIFLRDSLCLSAVLPYSGYDMIFWIFPIVPCHAFCM